MSIINCNVTQHGLQEQLLNIVVGFERPELEQQVSLIYFGYFTLILVFLCGCFVARKTNMCIQREQLVREMSENRSLLKNFEDMLLEELANSRYVIYFDSLAVKKAKLIPYD